MVRNPSRRIAKYSAKIVSSVIKQRFSDWKDSMVAQVTEKFTDLANLETQAKDILEAAGVSSIDIPFYLAFVRQLYRITQTHGTGTIATNEATLYYNTWVARGLVSTTLQSLASNLFGITITG